MECGDPLESDNPGNASVICWGKKKGRDGFSQFLSISLFPYSDEVDWKK